MLKFGIYIYIYQTPLSVYWVGLLNKFEVCDIVVGYRIGRYGTVFLRVEFSGGQPDDLTRTREMSQNPLLVSQLVHRTIAALAPAHKALVVNYDCHLPDY